MKVLVHHARFGAELAGALRRAHPDLDVVLNLDEARTPDDVDEAEVVIGMRFPPGMLDAASRLRWLQVTGAGADHVRGLPPDVAVTHAGSVPARAVAEHVCLGALCLPFVDEGEHQGAGIASALPRRRRSLAGRTMVVVGLGRIGSAIATRARALGVRVIAVARAPVEASDVEVVHGRPGLLSAAAAADVLVLAVPLTPFTTRLVDAEVLAALPREAVVINVARAEVVDEQALVSALQNRRIAAALLDVHGEEPLPPSSPLWDVPNLWVTPHCAYTYHDHPADVVALCLDNMARYRRREPLRNGVGDPAQRARSKDALA